MSAEILQQFVEEIKGKESEWLDQLVGEFSYEEIE